MGFIVDIHLSNDDLTLLPTIQSIHDTIIRRLYHVRLDDNTERLYISVSGQNEAAIEDAFENDHTIRDPTHVVTLGTRSIYSVEVVSGTDPVPTLHGQLGGFVLDTTSDDQGWIVNMYLPDREALLDICGYYNEHDVRFQITRLSRSDIVGELDTLGLTEQQRDLLLMALYNGYYDIPRRASQEDLANQLEVSTSAISQQLRRATARLIMASLDPEDRGGVRAQ